MMYFGFMLRQPLKAVDLLAHQRDTDYKGQAPSGNKKQDTPKLYSPFPGNRQDRNHGGSNELS